MSRDIAERSRASSPSYTLVHGDNIRLCQGWEGFSYPYKLISVGRKEYFQNLNKLTHVTCEACLEPLFLQW